jgi:hypothetical protein
MVKLYHITTCDAAKAILRAGFRDTVGTYGTDWSGVWLVDRPLDCHDTNNVDADTVLAVSLDCGPDDLSDYEWAQDGQSHQEWLIPADFVNKHTLAIVQLDRGLRRSA